MRKPDAVQHILHYPYMHRCKTLVTGKAVLEISSFEVVHSSSSGQPPTLLVCKILLYMMMESQTENKQEVEARTYLDY